MKEKKKTQNSDGGVVGKKVPGVEETRAKYMGSRWADLDVAGLLFSQG